MAALKSGKQSISTGKSVSPKFASFIFIVFLVSAFMGLWATKNWQIAQIRKQLAPPPPAAKFVAPKQLPEISTPSLKLPPSLPPTNQPALAQVPPKIDSEFSVTYKPGEELTNSIAENQQANAVREQAYRKSVDQRWADSLQYYQEAIELFHDVLKQAAHAQPQYDEISKGENYFTCLPHSITPEITGIPLATIGFQKQTNIIFTISIKGDPSSTRPLRISCDSGLIEIHPDGATVSILLNSSQFPSLNETKDVKTEEWKPFAVKKFSALIDVQTASLTPKNK